MVVVARNIVHPTGETKFASCNSSSMADVFFLQKLCVTAWFSVLISFCLEEDTFAFHMAISALFNRSNIPDNHGWAGELEYG